MSNFDSQIRSLCDSVMRATVALLGTERVRALRSDELDRLLEEMRRVVREFVLPSEGGVEEENLRQAVLLRSVPDSWVVGSLAAEAAKSFLEPAGAR